MPKPIGDSGSLIDRIDSGGEFLRIQYLLCGSLPRLVLDRVSFGCGRVREGGPPEVTLETSMGPFTVELHYKHVPRACRNFIELSRRGYYDDVKFHRIIKGFVVQGGDPTGTGRGGESIYGKKIEDKIKPELKHTGASILSMANAGPDTNGSQFFITLAPCPSLDGKHTIFGRVCKGMEIIKRLGSVQTDNNDSWSFGKVL
ncbi:hypothetical protein MLD38_016004 [Melastoma candidum]|uniref:Uncharacterized protein n=1 Tax=Melastoma candidum TaxID=119954 RepID=A0ACB9RHV2_9MYRT|nr:hypothetical protein MLD38_016004 [Melastoma candidum]